MKKLSLLLLLLIGSVSIMFSQKMVSGNITDTNGDALIGANVLVKGSDAGTITDIDGHYDLNVPDGYNTLTVSYTGYTTMDVELGASNTMDIMMSEGVLLSDIVVTGLGIKRDEKSLGYSTQQVSGELLAEANETNVINALVGKVAGVSINGGSGNMGGSSRILIRGANSLTGENEPLIIVDGVPVDNSNFTDTDQVTGRGGYDYGNAAQDINADDIESVNILKGGAAAIYGSRAANGVILITTKSGKSAKKGIGVSVNFGMSTESVTVLPDYQNQYGGGGGTGFDTLWSSVNPEAFADSNGDGVIGESEADYWGDKGGYALIPDYGTDESWGSKLDEGVMVRHWDAWDESDTDNYLKPREWASNPDNIRNFYETGATYNTSVSLNGSNDNGNFRVSYSNVNQAYIYPGSKLKKNTISFNGGYNLSDKLRAGVAANYINIQGKGRPGTGYDGNNVSQQFNQWGQRQWNMDHMKNYKNPDGTNRTWNRNAWNDATPHYTDNPYWTMYENYEEDSRDRVYGNVSLSYKLTGDLTLNGRLSSDVYTDRREERIAVYSQNTPFYSEDVYALNEVNKELILNYNPTLEGDFTLSSLIGVNRRDFKYNRDYATTVGGLNAPGFYNIDNSAGSPRVTDYARKKRVNSAFAQASIGYQNFLYLDLTARNDWSSTLPSDNNSYFYPSASLSYVFSEQLNSSVLSFGKLRLGWSQVGNDTDPYRLKQTSYLPGFGTTDDVRISKSIGGAPVVRVGSIKLNPELKPETTTSLEVGADLRFFNDRLGLDVSLYSNTTVDQIIRLDLSPTTGFTSAFINAGEMSNKGIELQLYGTPFKSKSLSWDVRFNAARNVNEVVSLYNDPETGAEITNLTINTAPFAVSVNATVGETFGSIKGFNYVYDDAGNKLVKANGTYVRSEGVEVIGSALPDFTGGLYNTLNVGPVSLGFLIDFQVGGDIFSTTNMWGKYSGILAETAENGIREDGTVVEGVYAPGTMIDDVDVSGQQNATNIGARTHFFSNQGYVINAADVYDASYIKLREIQLGFALPKAWYSSSGIQDVKLSFVGRNIAYLFKNAPNIDPEAAVSTGNFQGIEGAQLPAVRSLGFNLSLKF